LLAKPEITVNMPAATFIEWAPVREDGRTIMIFRHLGDERRPGKRLVTAALVVALVLAGSEARAALILAGNSDSSTFSNCSGSCSVNTPTSLGLSTWVLNINPTSFSATSNALAVPIAALQMNTGGSNPGNTTAGFAYNLLLTFTTPTASLSKSLDLTMNGSGNGANATETLSGFSGLSDVVLTGVTLSNFRFASSGTGGSFSNGNWTVARGNGGGNSPTLTLEADVTATPTVVPEPGTLAVIGMAFAGLGFVQRRELVRSL
jgi:hypothetical protein